MQASRLLEEEPRRIAGIKIFHAVAMSCIELRVECLHHCLTHLLPRWALPLQRRDALRTPAVGVTADEVEHILKTCHSVMWDKLVDPTYVLDKPRIHTAVRWSELGKGPHPIIAAPQPARSPDFNRPVEHFHHSLKREFRELLITFPGPRTLDGYWKLLYRAFNSCYKKDSVMKDVLGLPKLWKCVASSDPKQGVAGSWPPAKYR